MSLSGFCRERLHCAIVNGSVQLLFGSGHKGGGGSRTHNVRSGTRHIHDAGDGRKQDDGFHRQTGSQTVAIAPQGCRRKLSLF